MILLECEYWEFNDEQQKLYELDDKTDLKIEEGNLKIATFYAIDNISPFQEKYCLLSSGGINFAINDTYESVKSKIENNIIFVYN